MIYDKFQGARIEESGRFFENMFHAYVHIALPQGGGAHAVGIPNDITINGIDVETEGFSCKEECTQGGSRFLPLVISFRYKNIKDNPNFKEKKLKNSTPHKVHELVGNTLHLSWHSVINMPTGMLMTTDSRIASTLEQTFIPNVNYDPETKAYFKIGADND